MGCYSFPKDKEREEAYTRLLINEILPTYKFAKVLKIEKSPKEERRFWDLRVTTDRGSFTIEVKEDDMAKITENVTAEYSSRGKPSGIAITKADYWMVIWPHKRENKVSFLAITVEGYKRLIIQGKYFDIKKGRGDKGSNTCFYLFRGDVFRKYAKLVHQMPKDEYETRIAHYIKRIRNGT